MDLAPIISIIIPVYNTERWLSECISSVLNQSFTLFELILVDDGSADACPSICDSYAKNDSRVKVIHKVNAGVSAARNDGIKRSVGKYIMFIDADDLLPEGALKKLYDLIKNDDYDIVFGQYVLDYPRKQIPKATRLTSGVYSYQDVKFYLIDDGTLAGFLFGSVWGGIYQRSRIVNNNILFDEKVKINEDGLFNFLLIPKCNKIFVTEEIVYIYRQWKIEKLSALTKNNNYDVCQQVLKEYIKDLDDDFELQMQRREVSILFWNALRIEKSKCSWKEARVFLENLLRDKSVTCNFEKLDFCRMNKYKRVLFALLQHHLFFTCFFLIKYVAPVLRVRIKR